MNLYAESSAVLAWLLGETSGEQARAALAGAEHVVSSRLTLTECARVMVHAQVQGKLDEAQASTLAARLEAAHLHWDVISLEESVLDRVGRAFPVEPIRTLDAIHLASALEARSALPDLALLSFDRRIRECGERLGFEVLPASSS